MTGIDRATEGLSESEREALDRAWSVFGWQHLARYSGKSREWLDLTLVTIVRSARAARAAQPDPLREKVAALADEYGAQVEWKRGDLLSDLRALLADGDQ